MAPRSSAFLLVVASAAGLVCAQQAPAPTGPVKTLFGPAVGDGPVTLYGSVINVAPQATTYQINCVANMPGVENPACGPIDRMTVVDGPSKLEFHMTFTAPVDDEGASRTLKGDATCALAGETAICTHTMVETALSSGKTETQKATSTETVTDMTSYRMPVTITAGAEKLAAVGGGGGGSPSSGAPQPTGPNGAAPQTTSTKPNAAMPRMTQAAALVGGVAAIVGGAVAW